ncbi:MAG: FAD-binding domain-containing protein [Halolamina sp.]
MSDPPRIGVWHRDDLRLRDNAALSEAVTDADGRVVPLFVFDPQFYESGMACDGRIRFVHECIKALAAEYDARGTTLRLVRGDPREVIPALDVDGVYVNRSVTGRYGRERDDELFAMPGVEPVADDGIDWDDRPRRTYDWQAQAESYFETEPTPAPTAADLDSLSVGTALPAETETTTVEAVERAHDTDPDKRDLPSGGEPAAWTRLRSFAADITNYLGSISPPARAEEDTSHLSPYFAVGCLTPRQAYRHVETEAAGGQARSLFTTRLFWNRHFSQKLADWPGLMERAVNPVFRGLFRDRHDPETARAWKEGQTGFPLVDASMRALRETGWLNFRMRAMCTTFYALVLRNWWRVGADHFYRHLVDADPAINYAQWQMQSGLYGVHPLRIYDPAKQVRENDPDGEFVREYVPELRAFPTDYLDRPEKAPLSVQQECGVRIGEDYPLPVVDFEARREETRELFGRLRDRAKAALEDPEIRRRASLSRRHSREGAGVDDEEPPTTEAQAGLDEF